MISSGVLDSLVIGHLISNDPLVVAYRRELSNEIYRVTPWGGISYHLALDELWSEALGEAGFSVKDNYLFLKGKTC